MQDFNTAAREEEKALARKAKAMSHFEGPFRALDFVENALKDRDNSAILWEVKGKLHKDLHQDSEAVTAFSKAYNRNPDDVFVVMSYGGMLTKIKDFDGAELVYLTMFENQKNDLRYLTALGHVYQCQEEYGFAAACFGRARKLAPDDRFVLKRLNEIEQKFNVGYSTLSWDSLNEHVRGKLKDRETSIPALQHNYR